MKLATREQVFRIDQLAEQDFGFSHDALVEKAGQALAESFAKEAMEFGVKKSSRLGIWCGPGSNGADGKVMARVLAELGFASVTVLKDLAWDISDFDFFIDAYFGVGLNREVDGEVSRKFTELNKQEAKVFAVDIPSGLCANTGTVKGIALKALATFTLFPPKPGLFLNEGSAKSGRVFSVSFGMPPALWQNAGLLDTFLVDRKFARKLLPRRSATSNKTSFGHLLVIAGSEGMSGAAVMVTEAAARMGCGYVTLCSLADIQVKPDFLQLSPSDLLASNLKKYDAVVFGPGLGKSDTALSLLRHLLKHHPAVLVDADGLSLLAEHHKTPLPSTWILTPHAGELSRLTGVPSKTLEADRLKAVQIAEKQRQAAILFKGFRTVLRTRGQNFVIYSGNVALAKAGSGDVLAGFIGSLMAQGLGAAEAGALGAYLHGRIADDWLRRGNDSRTLMASDLPLLLNATLRRLKKSQ